MEATTVAADLLFLGASRLCVHRSGRGQQRVASRVGELAPKLIMVGERPKAAHRRWLSEPAILALARLRKATVGWRLGWRGISGENLFKIGCPMNKTQGAHNVVGRWW